MIGLRANIPEFAIHWSTELGSSHLSLERLRGGINNRVFCCGHGSQKWVIKGYAPPHFGQRDRMQAEVNFLRFASQVAPGFTPDLLQVDYERRCVVLEHIEGETFSQGESLSDKTVLEAVEFFRQLNAEPQLARRLIKLDAAEGFLSLSEHLRNVRERCDRMTCIHLDPELRTKARTLLNQLHSDLAHAEEHTSSLIDKGIVADTINPEERCISPSDFGFHNAIRATTGTRFIDFEFAGWDDPAKAVQDFILQPRVPIQRERPSLLEAFHLDRRPSILNRCKAIGPILKLKWVCIMLGVLQIDRLEQILSVMPEQVLVNFIGDRLEQARSYLRKNTDASVLYFS